MISTEHWPSPFENTPLAELADELEWQEKAERRLVEMNTRALADPGIVPAEVE